MAEPVDRERTRVSPTSSRANASVLLTGMMGSGKSSVGALLADRLGWSFVDTDLEVERNVGRTIAEIFAEEGEPAFRRMEAEVLEGLPEKGCVVALGGGAVVDPANRATLARKGRLVWLAASPETLARRVAAAGDARPLLGALEPRARVARLAELLAERGPAYAHAEVTVETDELCTPEVCETILAALDAEVSK